MEQQLLSSGLALMPALLLAHHRGWPKVTMLLGGGLALLSIAHVACVLLGVTVRGGALLPLLVVGPYIAMALGAGWYDEVQRYQAELRAAHLQLIQSEKLDSIGRIAAGVAHEVKNPLMIILTGAKILSKRLSPEDESTRAVLTDMVEAVERADKIISGLLSYARDGEVDLKRHDLNTVLEKSLRLVKHEVDKRRTRIVVALEPALLPVMLDAFKMQQVFVNVITNSLHAMEQDGEIHIRTAIEQVSTAPRGVEQMATVCVEDTGPGIPAEHLDKVFDPFFTTKPAGSGTGLGLSVCRQIIEMHGGTIDIGNRERGGARVTVRLHIPQETENDGTTDIAR
jgi:signal transduction histidine kinase